MHRTAVTTEEHEILATRAERVSKDQDEQRLSVLLIQKDTRKLRPSIQQLASQIQPQQQQFSGQDVVPLIRLSRDGKSYAYIDGTKKGGTARCCYREGEVDTVHLQHEQLIQKEVDEWIRCGSSLGRAS